MKLRLLVTAALVSTLGVGIAWGSLQPLLSRAGATVQRVSLALLALDLIVVVLLTFVVLQLSVGRGVQRLWATLTEFSGEPGDGPPLAALDRALRQVLHVARDERATRGAQVADLEASHARLLRLQAELVAADRLATVGKLAAGVAHEVGNPLAGILGYLSVVKMRAGGNAELVDLAGRIEREVERIDQIVRALLELGRPSRGAAQPVDVRGLVDSAVKLLSAGRDFSGVTVKVDGPDACWLRAESGPLSQVLVNLLLNAAQAMAGRGEIRVTLALEGAKGQIHVDDHGPGLPEAVRARLFEPFFTTKPAGQGTGLGLAVSRHLLSQFEGQLEASPAPGGGARFTVTLPAPEAARATPGAS